MKLMRNSMVALLSLAVLAGCTEDDPFVPPENEPVEHTFTYVPHADTPEITGIWVRGSFNEWAEATSLPMTESGGTWSVTHEFDPGEYEYKYLFNDIANGWAQSMCADATWGNPPGGPVVPGGVTCSNDNDNAILVIE